MTVSTAYRVVPVQAILRSSKTRLTNQRAPRYIGSIDRKLIKEMKNRRYAQQHNAQKACISDLAQDT
jgi:hypothetical protein